MFIIFGLIFFVTFVYLLVKRAQRKQFGITMKNKNKYILIGACILSGILFVISLSSSDNSNDNSNSSDRTSSSKKESSVKSSSESSSSETKKSESSSSSLNETKKSESQSASTNEGHQSAQTQQKPTQPQPAQTQQVPTQTQPTQSNDENTTVYVANNGKSLAYWYSANDMPANTNRSKVVAMTEAQAKQQGKHASLRE